MTAIVAVSACIVLIAVGLFALSSLRADDSPVPTLATQPDPLTDPGQLPAGVTVAVLDGGGDGAVADAVTQQLVDAGWPVAAEAQADEALEATIVYYADPELQAAALGLVEELGTGTIVPVDEEVAGSALTVALGADAAAMAGATTPAPSETPTPTPSP